MYRKVCSSVAVIALFLCMVSFVNCHPTRSESTKMPLQRAITYTKPIVPLEFQEKARKKPRNKNLKVTRLLKKMGEDYQPHWMSIEAPDEKDMVTVEMNDEQIMELEQQVSNLNLEQELKNLITDDQDSYEDDEESGAGQDNVILDSNPKLDTRSIAIFQQWLVMKSSCPVSYEWHDLGDYFWPRWIKKGSCKKMDSSDDNETPMSSFARSSVGCSWPLGMTCVPGQAKTLHILRWHCRRRSRKNLNKENSNSKGGSRYKCKWYKVPYPVTNSCKCACQ